MKVIAILFLFLPIYLTNASDTCWPHLQIKMNATKVFKSGENLAKYLRENLELADLEHYAVSISKKAKHLRESIKPMISCKHLKNQYDGILGNFEVLEERLETSNDWHEESEVFELFQKLAKASTKLRKSLFNK